MKQLTSLAVVVASLSMILGQASAPVQSDYNQEVLSRFADGLAAAHPEDAKLCLHALNALLTGEQLTPADGRAIRLLADNDDPIVKAIDDNLSKTARQREREHQIELNLLTESERYLYGQVVEHLKDKPLEQLPLRLQEFANGDGADALRDAIQEAALVNPGPLTEQATKLLGLSFADRGVFATAPSVLGKDGYRVQVLTVEIARVLVGKERLLTTSELRHARDIPFLSDALREYATPESQAKIVERQQSARPDAVPANDTQESLRLRKLIEQDIQLLKEIRDAFRGSYDAGTKRSIDQNIKKISDRIKQRQLRLRGMGIDPDSEPTAVE